MNTKMVIPCAASFEEAAQLINMGEVVGFPTETVYGLGADATNEEAVKKIFRAKGRPGDNPLIVHIASLSDIHNVIYGEMPEWAQKLAEAYWPGPLTMIFDKGENIPSAVTAGLDSVAVRIPGNTDAQALIRAARKPIAAPSANLSGRPSPTTAKHVFEDMNGRIPLIIDGGESDVGLESTVLDVRTLPVKVLRPGGVTPKMIADVVGEVEVAGSVMRPLKEGETVLSPGMKYKHYAPEGSLVIVKGAAEKVAHAIIDMYDATEGEKCILALEGNLSLYEGRNVFSLGKNPEEMAHRLFDALREMDARGINAIFSEAVDAEGIGLAVMNRLGRAAAFHIVDAGE
ncbi:MAG: threonylcarbamoyl-AMP synthase [Clostridiales bacterium]|nr:threonylcarbamoyl-AMP synthase [Clostridiales bacterium]